MPNEKAGQIKTELCIIKVMFPVNSDEKAFSIKRGIDSLLSDINDSRVEFTIKTIYGIPPNIPLPANFIPPKSNE